MDLQLLRTASRGTIISMLRSSFRLIMLALSFNHPYSITNISPERDTLIHLYSCLGEMSTNSCASSMTLSSTASVAEAAETGKAWRTSDEQRAEKVLRMIRLDTILRRS